MSTKHQLKGILCLLGQKDQHRKEINLKYCWQMDWPLGEYINNLLQQRGGRLAGWTQSRLAKKSGLSPTEISWIIRGEASGKKGTPSITVDTLLALSKALNVPDVALLAAYKGENPDMENIRKEEEAQTIRAALLTFINQLPIQAIIDSFSDPERFKALETLVGKQKKVNRDRLFKFLLEKKDDGQDDP